MSPSPALPSWSRWAVRLASAVYRATPWPALRKAYFRLFLGAVRSRRAAATVDGVVFDLDLSELIDVQVCLGQYELDMVRAIERFCRPGWCVLDIGANMGAHALRFARIVGETGRVVAFEPMPDAYARLERNISLNRFTNIRAVRVALSAEAVSGKSASFRSSWRSDGVRSEAESLVDFVRLDDWCRGAGIARVDLIKLDVDGAEFEVLEGGREVLRRDHPLLLMEVGAWHFRDPGKNPLGLLQELGYRFRDMLAYREYADLEAIRARLPESDEAMSFSINVLCTFGEGP